MSEPDPRAITDGRSAMEVAADTIAAIFQARLIPLTRDQVSRVSIATRVPVREIKDAMSRFEAGLWYGPSSYRCDDPEPRPPTTNRGGARKAPTGSTGRKAWNSPPDDEKERKCRGPCGRTLPLTAFPTRADKPGSRRWQCADCRKAYGDLRYLSVSSTAWLSNVMRFTVQQGDSCVDDTCEECHQPICVGDLVCTSDVVLVHHDACVRREP